MSVLTQCCGIVVLLVICFFHRRQKKISTNTAVAFNFILYMSLLCVSMDVISIVGILYKESLPELFVTFLCKTYLVTLVLTVFAAVMYACVDIYGGKSHKKTILAYRTFMFLGVAMVYLLPIYYSRNEQGEIDYTYGPSVLATYVTVVSFIIVIFYLIIRQKEKINAKRRAAVRTWVFIWLSAAVIQFIFGDFLISGFACAIGIMVLYLKLENPETYIDRRTGLFNYSALVQYVTQLYEEEKKFSSLSLVFSRDSENNARMWKKVGLEICEYLEKVSDAQVFKNVEDEIIFIFDDIQKAKKTIEIITERFKSGWGKEKAIHICPNLIYITEPFLFKKAGDFFYFMSYVKQNIKEYSEDEILHIDEAIVSAMYQEKGMEALLTEAIAEDYIEVFYQPIYSTKEHRFTSAEALVRIRDKQGRIIPPGAFIEIAEKNGMIQQIGEMVFDKVCRFIKENRIEEYGIHYIEANLSVVQCGDENLAEDYIRIMEKHHIPPQLINLEITESASLSAKKTLLDNMKKLMNYGVSFSLDDFGTGQSNLNYIVDMPVSIVKFDRDMINAYFENGKAKYVLDATMHMIHGMNLDIVSEGIESVEQYETMKELGISYIQGYYFSKPLPGKEFLRFVSVANE